MSNYCVKIGEREYQVKITESGLLLNDEPMQCDLISLNGDGLHQLNRERQSVEVHLSAASQGVYEVLIGGRRVLAHVEAAHKRSRRRAERGAGDITARMPGLIVDVGVQEGDIVQLDDLLLVQEAMKMQMQVRAPCAGCVTEVAVRAGAQVEKGTLLIKIVE
jgi:biotin carboxyl carrier protein